MSISQYATLEERVAYLEGKIGAPLGLRRLGREHNEDCASLEERIAYLEGLLDARRSAAPRPAGSEDDQK
jgi:hypothetical protein